MWRFIMLMGFVVIFAGACLLGGFIILDVPAISDFRENTFCDDNEEMYRTQSQTTNSDGQDATSIQYYCRDIQTGDSREVTDETVFYGLGAFAISFVPGLLMIIIGATRASQLKAKKFTQGTMNPQNQQQLQQMMGQMMNQMGMERDVNVHFSKGSYTREEIEERLAYLQQQVNSGQITQQQYQEIEQELRRRQTDGY